MHGFWVGEDARPDGTRTLHREDCPDLPHLGSRSPLGLHEDCASALKAARLWHDLVRGCPLCAPACSGGAHGR